MKLADDEKALYAELAVRLAIRMCERSDYYEGIARDHGADFEGCIVTPGLTSDCQDCWLALYELGILQAVNPDLSPRGRDPMLASFFRLKFGASGVRDYVAGQLPAGAPMLSRLIENFISLVAGYDYGIHTRREAFTVPPDFAPTFDLFARCGYVERVGDKVAWTDKIAMEMRAAHEWTEDLISESEAEDAKAEKMWRTMPKRLRDLIPSERPVDILALVILISQFWHKGEWRDTALDAGKDEIILQEASTTLAKKLAKKIEESGG